MTYSSEKETNLPPGGDQGQVDAAAQPLLAERDAPPVAEVSISSADRVARAYREHRDLVYRLALRYGAGNVAWAEDVTHEVFIALLKAVGRLDVDRGLEGWLYRVTTNRCLNRIKTDRFRRSAPVRWVLSQNSSSDVDPSMRVELSRELRAVLGYLQDLPAKERVAFCMHRIDGLSMSEIGDVLGFSKGYVSKLISRADVKIQRAAERDPS